MERLQREDFDQAFSLAYECLMRSKLFVQYPIAIDASPKQRQAREEACAANDSLDETAAVEEECIPMISHHEIWCAMADMYSRLVKTLNAFEALPAEVDEWFRCATDGPYEAFGQWHTTAHEFAYNFTRLVVSRFKIAVIMVSSDADNPGDFVPESAEYRDPGSEFYFGRWMPSVMEGLSHLRPLDSDKFRSLMQKECSKAKLEYERSGRLDDEPELETVSHEKFELVLPIRDLMANPMKVLFGVPHTAAEITPQQPCSHSPDFRSVNWYGEIYTFTPPQAVCVETLWAAMKTGSPEVGDGYLLERSGSYSDELRKVFSNNPAWGKMIHQGSTRGARRLCPPDGGHG